MAHRAVRCPSHNDAGEGWGYEEGAEQLPSVDDLEVAAAAATAAWDDDHIPSFISGRSPPKPKPRVLPVDCAAADSSSSSEDDSSSDEEESSSSDVASDAEEMDADEGVEDEGMWEFDEDTPGPFVVKLEVKGKWQRSQLAFP